MADPAPPDGTVDSDAIDELLKQAGMFTDASGAIAPDPAAASGTAAAAAPAALSPTPTTVPGAASSAANDPGMFPDQASIDELLRQATFEDPIAVSDEGQSSSSGRQGSSPLMPDAEAFKLPNFNQVLQDAQVSSIDLLRDVELNVKIELGRSRMLVEDVLRLAEGSVVELDKLAGDPVDVFVNDRLVARGEVLVLNDNFCVRVNEIVAVSKEEGL